MKRFLSLKVFAYILLALTTVMTIWVWVDGGYFKAVLLEHQSESIKEVRLFMTGIIVPLFAFSSTLLVIVNIRYQSRQNFINNFFNLIEQHHRLLENISSEVHGVSLSSNKKEFFDDLAQRIAYDYYHLDQQATTTQDEYENACAECILTPNINIKNARNLFGKNKIIEIYNYYFHVHHSDLGHYFRNLYHIVNFIDCQSFSQKTKKQYIGILRAQLSNYELVLLSYNCLHDYGQAFYPLVVKYNLNKSINDESRLDDNYYKRVIDIDVLKDAFPNLREKERKILGYF